MYIGLNHGAVFVGTVVIGSNAARTKVDAFPHRSVTQVSQVVGLGAFGQRGILDLNEIADVHLSTQLRTWPQTCERADQCALTDLHAQRFTLNMRKRKNHCAGLNRAIGNDAISAYAHAVTQADLAFKHTVHINLDILSAVQNTAKVKACWIGQPYALLHQGRGLP